MKNQTQVAPVVQAVFSEEMTQKGLADLRIDYPADLVVNMKDEAEFKKARKVKTERNKLVDAINRRRIDTTGELKAYGDSLIEEINAIYDVYVLPFEAEEAERKAEKERKKRELEELLAKERQEINAFTNFVSTSRGQGSQHISDTIEAVDLIETDCFHKELIHEAIETKKQVLADLTQMLSDAISQEKLAEEREALRIEQEKLKAEAEQKEAEEAERKAVEERKAKVQERLNNLRNMPMQYFGKTSAEINKKITSLNNYELPAEEFGDHLEEAKAAKDQVVQQLGMMAQQAATNEQAAKQIADQEAQKQQAEAKAKAEVEEKTKVEDEELAVNESLKPKEEVKPEPEETKVDFDALKQEALQAQKAAETAWFRYAKELPVGDERVWAFEVYESIRIATLKQ